MRPARTNPEPRAPSTNEPEQGADRTNEPDHVYVAINAHADPVRLRLPETGTSWRCDLCSAAGVDPTSLSTNEPEMPARSVAVFIGSGPEAPAIRRVADKPVSLEHLADLAGIDLGWWDIAGDRHAVPPDSLKALLRAMRIGADSPSEITESAKHLEEDPWRRLVPRLSVARTDRPETLPVTVADGSRTIELELTASTGERHRFEVRPDAGQTIGTREIDSRTLTRFEVRLPDSLPAGRWRIETENGPSTLIVTPGRCHLPDALRNGGRRFGLTTHLYSLRRKDDDPGIGDFETLARFVDAGKAMGADVIGLNPFHALFLSDPGRASPYFPSDRRFLDVRYLSEGAAEETGRFVDYPAVVAAKLAAAERGFAALADQSALDRFIEAGGDALRDFTLFQALEEKFASSDWRGWPAEAHSPQSAAALADPARLRFFAYVQMRLDQQLAAAAKRASGMALGLYRDLAVGAAPSGAEFWSQQERFAQDVAIGAPPDPFSPTGQIWGVPPLDPHALIREGLAGWHNLLRSNMRHAGALRIDHAMTVQRLFWVPFGATAMEGAYVRNPVDAMIAELALASHEANCAIVAEDLGTVPEGFGERLEHADILSTKVMWFERDDERFRPPEEWPVRAAACISTHDLATLAGFWEADDIKLRAKVQGVPPPAEALEAREREKHNLAAVMGIDASDEVALAPAAHATLARTPCSLVLAQAEDLVGEVEQLNLPGTDLERPNWRRRLAVPVEDLPDHPLAKRTVAAMKAQRP